MNPTKVLLVVGIVLIAALNACAQKKPSTPQYVYHPVAVVTEYVQGPVSFRRDVMPILQANCAVCHLAGGPGYTQSGFSVRSYATVMKGTKYGSVVNPGSGISSTLVWVLEQGADPSINMPKEYQAVVEGHKNIIIPSQNARPLSMSEVELIQDWIDQGAKNN